MYLHNIPDSISFLSILFHPKYYQFISSWRFHTQACSRRSTTQLMSGKIKLNDSSDSDVINTSLYCLPESATFNSLLPFPWPYHVREISSHMQNLLFGILPTFQMQSAQVSKNIFEYVWLCSAVVPKPSSWNENASH